MASEQAFNIKFVGEIEKRPELYNYNLPQYSRKDIVEKGWIEIGKLMNMTASQCKERWKNLRSVFVRNLRLQPSASGSKKRKPYYLMESMQFALPFIKANIPADSGYVSHFLEQSESQFDEDVDDVLETSGPSQLLSVEAPPLTPPLTQQPFPVTSSQQPPSTNSQQPPLFQEPIGLLQPSNLNKKKPGPKREISSTDLDTSIMDFLQIKTAKLTAPNETDKKTAAIKSFLDSLIPELEPMTDQQMKTFRRRIFQLIDEITSETPPSTKSLSHRSPSYSGNSN